MNSSNVKKVLKYTGVILLCVVLVCAIMVPVLFWNELRTLASIKKVDDYGLFQMTYYGDYGFDEFLETGATSDRELEAFITKRLLKGLPIDLGVTGGGCTVFVANDDNGDIIMGRNWDFSYSPGMQVVTHPTNGYASVSTVNLAFTGYTKDSLPSGLNPSSFLSLGAPFMPIDGMNEKGVAIALLAVPEASLPTDESKTTLSTTTAIRLVLDKAATVEEAVRLLRQYNIYFSQDIACHYLICDASGNSALVEYYDGEMQVVTTEEEYQVASNFIAHNEVNIGEGYNEFERYYAVRAAIENSDNSLSMEQAVALLAEVGITYQGEDKLEWTVVYNLSNLDGNIFANRNTDNLVSFELKP